MRFPDESEYPDDEGFYPMSFYREISEDSKLDPDFKRQWVSALRSGDYRQSPDRLRSGDSHCCLGVACDLIDPGAWKKNLRKSDYNGCTLDNDWDQDWVWKTLPSLWEPIYYSEPFPLPLDDGVLSFLIESNEAGKSFDEIADWIEEYL